MCGRFTLSTPADVVGELFGLATAPALTPRYNIAPSQGVAVVRAAGEGRELVTMRWGLIPSWAKGPEIGDRLINARSETAAGKPSFRAALRQRRCVLPADGFFEWRKDGPRKQPHLICFRDRRPFAMAGLWERWTGPEGPVESCTILTTVANEVVAPIHERMPVIIPRERCAQWLAPGAKDQVELAALLCPHDPAEMEAYTVSLRVNNPAHDDAQCVAPIEPGGYASSPRA